MRQFFGKKDQAPTDNEIIAAVVMRFPDAHCQRGKTGFCICLTKANKVFAFGKTPRSAWKNALLKLAKKHRQQEG